MYTLNCKGQLLVIEKPVVMGILNITPDSFYSGSRIENTDTILQKAQQMLNEGATILDIGGQSTRPGSTRISADEELKRVMPAIRLIKQQFQNCFISIDTYYSKVAKEAVIAGADMVNDISAGTMDEQMISTVATLDVPFIAMHMQGTPDTMQQNPAYENVTREVLDYFITKTGQCKAAGIQDIIIDPGFGFGKTIAHNFQLLRELEVFQILKYPLLAGLSRKSTIYKTLGTTAEEALNGTTVLNTIALQKGASILRVHDVKETMETIKLVEAVYSK
ncbi:MAG: dihydropteroate synthase [Chitinophagaceae bacterium]|jgi:dihydropteroate synthase